MIYVFIFYYSSCEISKNVWSKVPLDITTVEKLNMLFCRLYDFHHKQSEQIYRVFEINKTKPSFEIRKQKFIFSLDFSL